MKIFTRTETLSSWLVAQHKLGRTIGFIPTMGALHEGHLSLVRQSKVENDITVCSLFVNPSQFNDSEDLMKYPRNHDVDMAMLIEAGCEVTFLPSVLEVYPPGLKTQVDVDLHGLERRFEGEFRPGHFDGMMEVVHRLLQIVKPQRLYMGQKDYQQQAIVSQMIKELGLDVQLIVCPIIRERDGLAMSSRNALLTPEFRQKAIQIRQTLLQLVKNKNKITVTEMKERANRQLIEAGLKPEYIEICDMRTLESVVSPDKSKDLIVLAAAWAGNVRLIDNIIL